MVSIVDSAQPQKLIEAWVKNAEYRFVFSRQHRGKLDTLTNLVECGPDQAGDQHGSSDSRFVDTHELLDRGRARRLCSKVAIAVLGPTVDLIAKIDTAGSAQDAIGLAIAGGVTCGSAGVR